MAHPYASQPVTSTPARDPGNALIRAAQYLRMSTEEQKFSIENQVTEIRRYADQHGFEIVRTYADEAKSGLRIENRAALTQLIKDVSEGQTDFTSILVYDVSRWGRFQDTDESAYYEYICRRVGVHVHYCDEPFKNDITTNATVLKSLKRAMAAEFSRELSVKIFTVQAQLASRGFVMCGSPGYGLRRLVLDEHGRPKLVLKTGEHKYIRSHRIVFIPGPPEEVEVVRRIYRMYVDDGLSQTAIANMLNREGISWAPGKLWDRGFIRRVLINEKYIGNNIYNRMSVKLRKKRVRNPPEMWIRCNGAFEPIVDPSLFEAARRIRQERHDRFSKERLLAKLRAVLAEHGRLTGKIINARPDIPAKVHNYWHVYGGMTNAYKLIGYTPTPNLEWVEHKRRLRSRRQAIIDDVISAIKAVGITVRPQSAADTVTISEELTAVIVVSRPQIEGYISSGRPMQPVWKIDLDPAGKADLYIVVRLERTCERILDYYVLPPLAVGTGTLHLHKNNPLSLDAYRINSLEGLATLMKQTPLNAIGEAQDSQIGSRFSHRASFRSPRVDNALYRTPPAFKPRPKYQGKCKTERAAHMLREYAREAAKQLVLERRTAVARDSLDSIVDGFRRLAKDEYFMTLLRTEGLPTMPAELVRRLCRGGTRGSDAQMG